MVDTHLDASVLSALREVMGDEYPMLLDTFLTDSEERLCQLRKGDNAAQLVAAAHSFKGSSSNMGAVRLARLCHELERRAQEKSPIGIEQLVVDIVREFAVVRPLYEAERQRSLSSAPTVRRF